MGRLWQRWCSLFMLLTLCCCWSLSDAQPDTVQLELGSNRPANNTVVVITSIGNDLSLDGGDLLVCATQHTPCCRAAPNRFGEWYYPNTTRVPIGGDNYHFYRTRRDSNSVNNVLGGALLNRHFDAMGPTGIYNCVIRSADETDQTLYVGLYSNSNNDAQLDPINFALTSGSAQSVTFSLTCTSNGGPINSTQWEKDGVAATGSNIYPDLTDAETATYSNTLQVIGRETGVYTCTATDGGILSLSTAMTVEAANPPLAVSASLNMISGRVLISWGPPAAGGAEVTGYRVYYNADNKLNDVSVNDGTLVQFELDPSVHTLPISDMMISIRAESAQLPSELVTVNVTVLPTPPTTTSVMAPTTTSVSEPTTTVQTSTAIAESSITAIETSTMVLVVPSTTTPASVEESTSTMVTVAPSTTTTKPTIATVELTTATEASSAVPTSTEVPVSATPVEPTEASMTATPTLLPSPTPLIDITAVTITPSGTATTGETYRLECSVTVTGSTDTPTITWLDDGVEIPSTDPTRMVFITTGSPGSYSSTLMFNPLRASDAGMFMCRAALGGAMNSQSFNVTVQVPDPSITVTSDPVSPIIAGSNVTVICTIELNQNVDVELTVTTVWTAPAGVTLSSTDPLMESTTTYTSTAMVSPFERIQSGVYSCRATLSSDTLVTSGMAVSGMERITVGVYLSLKRTVYANNSVIPITEIGETSSNTGLQCITDRMSCCRSPNTAGEWYFPDGMEKVPIRDSATSFYRNRGDGAVNLNRLNTGIMSPTGLYCCEVPDATDAPQRVCANIVSYSVVITPSAAGTPTAGEIFSLNCSVSGTTDPVTYQWINSNGAQLTNVSQLVFSPLRASHADLYTCQATVGSVMLEGITTVEVSLPAPTSVMVPPPMSTIIAGSSPNLTCTVELSPAVDVPVNVTTEWTSPDMTTVTPTSSVMESLARYTIMAMVDAARGGNYTCQATLRSSSQFIADSGMTSGSATIAVAPLPVPTILTITSPSPTSITLTWVQTEGADAVNSYEINYEYSVNECGVGMGNFPAITVMGINGSLRSYTLTDSTSTPVEEDSRYFITLTAVNNVMRSNPTPPLPSPIMTAAAAPGAPQFLRIASVDVTNITIQWDRVDCVERNGRIDSYVVMYYSTSNPSARQVDTVFGTEDSDRVFNRLGLPPRTSYTFEVEANNPLIRDPGANATINISTTAPQNFGFLLSGVLLSNNSVVTQADIGSRFSGPALYCLTPNTECCSSSVSGEWYLPDGTPVSSSIPPFSRRQVPSAVSLLRNVATPPTGVFRCEIPDASGTRQDMYVGIYPEGVGSPSVMSVVFDRNSTTLTCTSTRGPPTTVVWKKNNRPINTTIYEQSQRLMDAESATYENTLFNDNVTNFVGAFTCEVSNVRGTDEVTRELNGITIDPDLFNIGVSATARCISDVPATQMEWLNEENKVVVSTISTQQLDLVFSLVNDSIHEQVYVCRVIRNGGMVGTQNFTVDVIVPPTVLDVTISSSGIARAGMVYNLTCNVSKTVDGLTNSSTATWTTGGVAVSNRNGITVSTMSTETAAVTTLTFDPLRTSHDGRYSCNGTLTSPALQAPLMPFTVIEHRVQISTPDVNITVLSGSLFAGSTTPLTLTCTISIDPATDTDVSVTADNMDVTWMRGSTGLSDGDARVTISSVSGSRPLFTSTLTLDPLSIVDNTTFTCQARARPPQNQQSFIITSEVGEGTVSVIVNLPSPPTVRISPVNSLETAGRPLSLNCSASIQDGISGTATLTWTRVDDVLPIEATSEPPLLSFSSLRTNHGGKYTCTARLFIPEAGVDVSGDNTASISVQVPPPTLTITGSPRNTSFFQGLDLTFTCSITLDEAVDTPVTVQGTWNRNGTELMDGDEDGRIIITNPLMNTPPYQTTLRFNLLNISDAGTYQCSVTVTPQNTTFITTATASISRTIAVAGFPTQLVNPIADEGISSAGFSGYTLICNTSRERDLLSTTTLAVQWLDPRGNIISSGTNFTISGAGPTMDIVLTSRLTFNNLYTSQAGEYTCRTLQTIPGTVTNHPEPVTFTVQIKLPAPVSPLTFRRSRGTTLNAGTSFSLSCVITSNTTGVDTDFMVQSSITGPGISSTGRVSISQPMLVRESTFETTVTFSHLLEADAGAYNCSAFLTSSQPNVVDSDSTSGLESIDVGSLQAPIVTISAVPIPIASNQHTITCIATVEEYLIAIPTLEWRLPENAAGASTGIQSTTGTISTTTLTFSNIRTSQGGIYECRATINITGFNPLSQTANQTIQVQIPPPSVSVLDPPATPYNGTNFTITGMIQLDQNVDTDITASGMWSSGDEPQETTSPPYPTSLTFQPLATNNSGVYTLTVSVRPSDNSPYIVGNNGSTIYNLVVRSLPSRPPTIAVVSHRFLDECGEVMTLNCTANQVANLFTPPTITWIAPGGSEVPTMESSNPRMDSRTRQLIFSGITTSNRGTYTCRTVVNIPEAQIVNYIDEATVEANTDFPGVVQNLVCTESTSPSDLSFSWEQPTVLGNEVVGYQVTVNRLEHRAGTREVVQAGVYSRVIGTKDSSVSGFVGEVPYNITVKALNLAGCGEEEQLYCFTQEGVPPPPENVVVVRFDSTSIGVSWTKFTLVELKGLANYIVTYNIIIGSRKRQTELGGMITAPWTQNQVIIRNLQPGAEYDVTVSTSTTTGISAPVGPDGIRVSMTTSSPRAAAPDNTVAIIGGVAVVIVLIIAATIVAIIVIALIFRSRRAEFKPSQRPLPYEEPGGVMLSDLSSTNKEKGVYETIEADHE